MLRMMWHGAIVPYPKLVFALVLTVSCGVVVYLLLSYFDCTGSALLQAFADNNTAAFTETRGVGVGALSVNFSNFLLLSFPFFNFLFPLFSFILL